MTIYPFKRTTAEYEQYVDLYNSILSDQPASVTYEQRQDETWPEDQLRERVLIVDEDARALAAADYYHLPFSYHPRKFGFMIFVREEVRRQGLGTRLYNYILDALAPYDPLSLEVFAREDWADSVRFLDKRGFRVVNHQQQSELDPAAFDADRFKPVLASVAASGLEIRSLREVMADDPDIFHRVYDLENEVAPDVPWYDEPTPRPFAEWVKSYDDNPDLLYDGYIVALDGQNVAGVSQLWGSQATDTVLYTGFTAVGRPYRHRGLATAMKVHAIQYAQSLTSETGRPPKIFTNNEENNPMLQINLRLGFKERPALLVWIKEFLS